jgi:hypothetical protein
MNRNERIMQPYIPYIVLEALVAERVREIEGLRRTPAFRSAAALRRLGALLVRLGGWLQRPLPEPMPRTT